MMRLPRPASPRALWNDIRAFAGQRSAHHWVAAALAITIPVVIFVTFAFDTKDAHKVPPQIIYVESWSANRTAEETRANIEALEARRKAGEEERRKSFQKIEDFNNRIGL